MNHHTQFCLQYNVSRLKLPSRKIAGSYGIWNPSLARYNPCYDGPDAAQNLPGDLPNLVPGGCRRSDGGGSLYLGGALLGILIAMAAGLKIFGRSTWAIYFFYSCPAQLLPTTRLLRRTVLSLLLPPHPSGSTCFVDCIKLNSRSQIR